MPIQKITSVKNTYWNYKHFYLAISSTDHTINFSPLSSGFNTASLGAGIAVPSAVNFACRFYTGGHRSFFVGGLSDLCHKCVADVQKTLTTMLMDVSTTFPLLPWREKHNTENHIQISMPISKHKEDSENRKY
jgi:hypothetical protein